MSRADTNSESLKEFFRGHAIVSVASLTRFLMEILTEF